MPSLLPGAILILGAEFLFAAMGATVRHLSGSLDNEMLVFCRNLVGLVLLAPVLLPQARRNLATRVPHLHLLRGLAGLGAMYCLFYALAHMPLAEAMLLKLSAPLFIPLVALFWLGEAVTLLVAVAVVIGFAGVTVILTPDFAGLAPAAAVALLGGLFAAVAKVAVRRLSRSEPAGRIVFYFALIATLVSSIPLLWAWRTPPTALWPWLLALGAIATGGQVLLTRGFAAAPAGRLAPFTYFSVVFAALLGWLFWDERLSATTLVGTLLVMTAGLLAARRRLCVIPAPSMLPLTATPVTPEPPRHG